MNTTTNYFVNIELLDRVAVRNETDLDLDPTMPGQVSAKAFWAQRFEGRYSLPEGLPTFMRIEATTAEDAAEIAFGILNSYPANLAEALPAELHCDLKYVKYVQAYRNAGHRSLSKGDIVIVRAAGGPMVELGVDGAGFVNLTPVVAL